MKTTITITCKNENFIRKVREQRVEAIETISVSLKTLSMIHWTSSMELSILGY